MIATRIRQKDGIFYFVSFKARDILNRVKFTSRFYVARNASMLDQIEVPCVIFDGKTGDFAAEMFVIINSTQTRINKSHLVDLLDRISRYDDETRLAASLVHKLYEETTSPLQYKINRLGGRSRQEKWILQAELFNEIKKLIVQNEKLFMKDFRGKPDRAFELIVDYLKAVRTVMERVCGDNDRYKFTTSVTLKAVIRVLGDLTLREDLIEKWRENPTPRLFEKLISPWANLKDEFRNEGFYERFPAKGQIERVRVIEQRLLREIE